MNSQGAYFEVLQNGLACLLEEVTDPRSLPNDLPVKPPIVDIFSQSKKFTQIKADIPELTEVYDKVLRNVLQKVQLSFDNFFRRVKSGEKAGYPRFKSSRRYDSFSYGQSASKNSQGISSAPGWILQNNRLVLKMGAKQEPISPIKIKLHRPAFGRVQTLTIKRTNVGHWYASLPSASK